VKNRGQVWPSIAGGFAILIAFGLFLVNISYVYFLDDGLRSEALERSLDPARVNLFDNMIRYGLPIVAFLVVCLDIIGAGRKSGSNYYGPN
jgi:hypothetical protein